VKIRWALSYLALGSVLEIHWALWEENTLGTVGRKYTGQCPANYIVITMNWAHIGSHAATHIFFREVTSVSGFLWLGNPNNVILARLEAFLTRK
jgi:hypothetical protein